MTFAVFSLLMFVALISLEVKGEQVQGQGGAFFFLPASQEDGRCKCVCPKLSILNADLDLAQPNRQVYVQSDARPADCKCENLVLEQLRNEETSLVPNWESLQLKEKFCPRCTCRYETRNTGIIKIVVILIVWVIFVLSLYMAFLLLLDPWLKRNRPSSVLYHEQQDDIARRNSASPSEQVNMVAMSSAAHSSGSSVFHRVGHQQSKWQRKVQEQRRNIYDRRTILN